LNMFILRLKVTVEGLENIPLDSPLVVYSNHKSYTDAFSILEFFPRPLTLTPKKSVMKIPIVNLWLKSYDVFPINRSNHRETAKDLDKAIQTVKNGHAILLFPEGSIGDRLKDQVNTMKAGSFKLALKSGANILVVKLEGNDLVRRRAPFKISYRKVVIKPLIMHESIANMSTQEIANLVMDTINK
ncbi:MAG: 1-acyl-sn-glycerol-3-phosphate acyltransferase, partial [Acholeplasmataceae bacterium]|nr:1-acyl-sn-glycerol-3-phosphate acyltransferase [Acholeplasmataceae bacterium]